jgi:hypothetical protein
MVRRAGALALAVGCASCGSSGGGDEPDASVVSEGGMRDTGLDTNHEHASDAAGPSQGILAVSLTGCSAYGYLAEVEIEAEKFQLVVDTGSTTLAVAATGCTSCGVSPLYTPGPHAVDEHETTTFSYGTDAGSSGEWSAAVYEDIVSVGALPAASARTRLAAIQSQMQFFFPMVCGSTKMEWQGLVGFAPAPFAAKGTNGYFDELVAESGISNVFATALCDTGGHLWLGGYDPAYVTAPPEYTPMSSSANAKDSYVVDLESVAIGGMSASIPIATFSDTILDTGNTAFFLPPAAFETAVDAIVQTAGFQADFADQGPPDSGMSFLATGSCVLTSLTKEQVDSTLPSMTLVFGTSSAISVTANPSESYLVPGEEMGKSAWCSGIYPLTPTAGYPFAASLGVPVLRSSVVIFDREKSRIGFAPHTACP